MEEFYNIKKIKIEDIKILDSFNKPSLESFELRGQYPNNIVITKDFYLISGYTVFLLNIEKGANQVSCLIINENYNENTISRYKKLQKIVRNNMRCYKLRYRKEE